MICRTSPRYYLSFRPYRQHGGSRYGRDSVVVFDRPGMIGFDRVEEIS